MMKRILKNILPVFVVSIIQKQYRKITIIRTYLYDLKRYYKYSGTKDHLTRCKLEANIIKEFHIIEKGLTMPQTRLGFGELKMLSLCEYCNEYISQYGISPQLKNAIGVIKEYKEFHEKQHYELNENVSKVIEELLNNNFSIPASAQIRMTKEVYFKEINTPFTTFSDTRRSVRNYTDESIPEHKLISALKLVLNTPSACNRQSSRVYVFSNNDKIKEILDIQGGARGFGHLANRLIVITSELGVFSQTTERYQSYIDGGMFAMNLLYALHANEIACCILNCSNTPQKDKLLQDACKIAKSEVFIAMIACGIPPEEFEIAVSPRYSLHDICTFL